ncbi:MAG TPA: reverse transcriptase-like protein [Nitrosopumilus sp.]|nr:reverse transcriptase-like protein [Nitrosopumilus sp.]
MNHVFYSDGDSTKISWLIQTEDNTVEQTREHVEIYKNKITDLQSKYVALHIGLFWGIGVFIIKNEDLLKIKIDEKTMFEQLNGNEKINDEFIQNRIKFIKQLIVQRKLKVQYEFIKQEANPMKKNI